MARTQLRAVGGPAMAVTDQCPGGDSILVAAEEGDRIGELTAMRRRLAMALDNPDTPARELAPLSRRLMEIGREIETLEVAVAEDQSVVVNSGDEAWDESAI